MKALRIVLTQTKAHYRKEETITNKMTYPLPPFSTVIGAIHKACAFKEYHPMDLSIQGKYKTLIKQAYTDYCFLNSVMDDRGILVRLKNSVLHSTAFEKVATAMKSQGNSFRKDITVQVHNKKLIKEYRELKNLKDEIDKFKKTKIAKVKQSFKNRKKTLKEKKSKLDKKSDEFKFLTKRENQIKLKESLINERVKEFEFERYTREVSRYQSLTTALRFYELLLDVELIIHISSDEETLKVIEENIYNLKAIGRSEDFVDIKECKLIELSSKIDDEFKSKYSAYLDYESVKEEKILLNEKGSGIYASGTKYWINKNYDNTKGKRVFEKKKVVFASNYLVEEENEGIYLDENFIVNFN